MMYAEYKMQEVCKDKVKTKKQHISVPETLPETKNEREDLPHETEEQKNHPSETALDDVEPDYIIENSYTLDNLKQLNLLVIDNIEGKKING